MNVVFFHRKRFDGAYSIEALFDNIRKKLPSTISYKVIVLKYLSQGFFNRLYIIFEAAFNQGDVNHITGDVHFIALLLNKKRTILTIHDTGFMSHPKPIERFLLEWFWLILPISRCGVITVVSEATKASILEVTKKWISPNIHVIYNPIGEKFIRSERRFKAEEPVILQIGAKPNKNLVRLIEAIAQIKCKLIIVGSLSEKILTVLKTNGTNYQSYINLSDSEIVEKYEQADIVSFISINEGFGLPIVEANAIGRVVVTSNISSMPEIAGNAAHFVDPFNINSIREGFLKVIKDDRYRDQLIENGFLNRERFDISKIAAQYSSLYQSLV